MRKPGDMLRSVYDPNNDGKFDATQVIGVVKDAEFGEKFSTNFETKIERGGSVYIASDTVALQTTTVLSGTSTTLAKVAELVIPVGHAPNSNSINVEWEYAAGAAGVSVSTQLHLNGHPMGGLETTTGTTFVKVVGSMMQLTGGDKVQVFGKTSATATHVKVQNMKIKATVIPNTVPFIK